MLSARPNAHVDVEDERMTRRDAGQQVAPRGETRGAAGRTESGRFLVLMRAWPATAQTLQDDREHRKRRARRRGHQRLGSSGEVPRILRTIRRAAAAKRLELGRGKIV